MIFVLYPRENSHKNNRNMRYASSGTGSAPQCLHCTQGFEVAGAWCRWDTAPGMTGMLVADLLLSSSSWIWDEIQITFRLQNAQTVLLQLFARMESCLPSCWHPASDWISRELDIKKHCQTSWLEDKAPLDKVDKLCHFCLNSLCLSPSTGSTRCGGVESEVWFPPAGSVTYCPII